MKKIIVLMSVVLSLCVASCLHADVTKQVFISFSMPEQLIDEVLKEAETQKVTVVLNGLIDDDFRKTMSKLFELSQAYPQVSVQLDPLAFDKYHIDAVPALVVDNGKTFDVVMGNLSLESGLALIKQRGDLKGEAL